MTELRTKEMNRVLGIQHGDTDDNDEIGDGIPRELEEGDEAML